MLAGVIAVIVLTILFLQEPVSRPAARGNAPELHGIEGYINTKNISIGELVGKKVILVDFWTYTCINCQRTLPYLTMWDDKYREDGLVIIGVHSPEFAFEKKYENVARAVKKFGIQYPVVLDNNHATWRAYANRFWPHKYLIDIDGNVAYDHIGEGGYEETEQRIRAELEKRKQVLGMDGGVRDGGGIPESAVSVNFSRVRTPEIYLGYQFMRGNFGHDVTPEQEVTFSFPGKGDVNTVYLDDDWIIRSDHAELVGVTGKIRLRYSAKVVNIVASGASDIDVTLEGKPPRAAHGSAVNEEGKGVIDEEDLYELVNADYNEHTIEIMARRGFKIYTFTFG